MKKGESKAPSQRQLRVGEELRHALAWILERGEIRDPGLGGVAVTVTEVRISPDLGNATAFVMPLGGGDVPSVVEALNRAVPFVRRQLGKAVKLRRLPALDFVADTSFDEAGRIEDLLKTPAVARDLGPRKSTRKSTRKSPRKSPGQAARQSPGEKPEDEGGGPGNGS